MFIIAIVLFFGIVAVLGYLGARAVQANRDHKAQSGRAELQNPNIKITDAQNLSFDPRDEKALLKNSEEVFSGRVEKVTGREDNHPMPFLEGWSSQAQFRVRVSRVVKVGSGNLLKRGQTLTVNQLGVPPPDAKARVDLANEYNNHLIPARILQVGRNYIFATEYNRSKDWHSTRVDPFGWMCLGENVSKKEAREVRGLDSGKAQ